MGLFGRRTKPPPPQPKPAEVDPFRALGGLTVTEASTGEGRVAITFQAPAGPLRFEASCKMHMRSGLGADVASPFYKAGTTVFAQAVASLKGRTVTMADRSADTLALFFSGEPSGAPLFLMMYTGAGDYAGEVAATLTGPGDACVMLDKDGYRPRQAES